MMDRLFIPPVFDVIGRTSVFENNFLLWFTNRNNKQDFAPFRDVQNPHQCLLLYRRNDTAAKALFCHREQDGLRSYSVITTEGLRDLAISQNDTRLVVHLPPAPANLSGTLPTQEVETPSRSSGGCS
jgi:hypothetical protein